MTDASLFPASESTLERVRVESACKDYAERQKEEKIKNKTTEYLSTLYARVTEEMRR